MNLNTISREDLLLKITQIRAENTAMRIQAGKDKSYIQELEDRLKYQERRINEIAMKQNEDIKIQLDKCREKKRNQKDTIYHLNEKLKNRQ